ncbi:MAG: M48 family metallopeptidase [Clostridiales bacterium]|nr:M48 family metallopeptidase [Clostridiales bacterium]
MVDTINIAGFECRLKPSARRRTVCIRIADDGVPELLVPALMPESEVRSVAEKYRDWIIVHCDKRREVNASRAAFTLSVGDKVRCLGGVRTITEHSNSTVGYDETAFYLPRGLDSERLRRAVIQIYKLLAKNHITQRVSELAEQMKLEPMSVKINAARSHWATCSKRDTLNFTWYSIMADPRAIDYIIIHELCHMWEFNHSARFWALVGRWCPEYQYWKQYLNNLWHEIQLENWD